MVLYIPEALGADRDVYLPEAGSQFVFRNESGGGWLMMVGSGTRGAGAAAPGQMATLLFAAPDLAPTTAWRYVGPQFVGGGAHGGAWCPFFAPLGDPADPTAVVMDYQNWVGRG